MPRTLVYVARLGWTVLLLAPPVDALAAARSRAHAMEQFAADWRYAARIRAVQTYDSGHDTVHPRGTPLDHVGPFQPEVTGQLLDAPIATDADGYRRQNGPWPTCAAAEADAGCVEGTVLCVGGSTTWGVTFAPDDLPYPDVLERLVNEGLPHYRVRAINAGVSGEDVRGARLRAERHFEFAGPADVLVFYGGVNAIPDRIRGRTAPRVSFVGSLLDRWRVRMRGRRGLRTYDGAPYAAGVRALVAVAREAGVSPVLVTFALPFTPESPPEELAYWDRLVMWHTSARTMAELVARHNAATVRVAREERVPLVDAASALSGRPDLFVDEEHFTQPGREALAALIAPAVVQLLAGPPPRP